MFQEASEKSRICWKIRRDYFLYLIFVEFQRAQKEVFFLARDFFWGIGGIDYMKFVAVVKVLSEPWILIGQFETGQFLSQFVSLEPLEIIELVFQFFFHF